MIHDTLSGIVIHGRGRGKALGFPTANLQLDKGQIQPPTGVFAGRAHMAVRRPATHHPRRGRQPVPDATTPSYPAAIHIGPAPTFNDPTYTVEVHMLDYPGGDLYDQRLTVELVEKIRDVKKFSSEEELVAAIAADCVAAQKLLTA